MLRNIALAAAIATGLGTGTAQAALLPSPEIYDWSFAETDQYGPASAGTLSGTLTVEDGLVTAITGTSTFGTITALLPSGSMGSNDNAFPLGVLGIAFTLAGTSWNLYRGGLEYWLASYDPVTHQPLVGSRGTFTATLQQATEPDPQPVPEPMGLALFGLGLAGLAAARRRAA